MRGGIRLYFYPRPPRGGRPFNEVHKTNLKYISIHALREEGDRLLHQRDAKSAISIHALREEGDLGNTAALSVTTIFLSTPSARRATPRASAVSRFGFYFYPRPPRGGRHRFGTKKK